MPRYVALLRGINVGGHRVKMDDLRAYFEGLKFKGVSTFIASGNVLFDSPGTDAAALERKIEAHLQVKLGYEAPTFLRTPAELAAIARHVPFSAGDMTNAAWSRYVLHLRDELPASLPPQLRALDCATDEFRAEGREIHWLCRGKISDNTPAAKAFEKLLRAARIDGTLRNIKTVVQLAELAAAAPDVARRPPAKVSAAARPAASGRSRPGRARKACGDRRKTS